MKESIFHKSFQTRLLYIENPISNKEYLKIVNLCDKEMERWFYKITISSVLRLCAILYFSIVLWPFLMALGIMTGSFTGIILFALSPLILLMIIASLLKPKVCINVEGVKFKSTDSLGRYRKESDNRLLPCGIEKNMYAKGTIHYDFFERVIAMDRPVLRFELDILNILNNEH